MRNLPWVKLKHGPVEYLRGYLRAHIDGVPYAIEVNSKHRLAAGIALARVFMPDACVTRVTPSRNKREGRWFYKDGKRYRHTHN